MSSRNWLSFEDAREYVQGLGLKTFSEWQSWAKSSQRPLNIPASPWFFYKEKGWISVGDWLRTGHISTSKRVYRPFIEARKFVRNLALRTVKEWREWAKSSKRPVDIPITPHHVYKKEGWIGYYDWLGLVQIHNGKSIKSFEDAREYVQSLKLKNLREWQDWIKSGNRPDDIPYNPSVIYRGKGWDGLVDWLGNGSIFSSKFIYRPFMNARSFVHDLGLKNVKEWKAWTKSSERPEDIPVNPRRIYKNEGWVGLRDWLGTERIYKYRNKKCSFEEARDYVRSLGLKSYSDWKKWSKSGLRPNDIPAGPWNFYKGKGWISIGDWLGTYSIAYSKRIYLPFSEARNFVRILGLKTINEWREWSRSSKRPCNIPMSPQFVYRNKGWIGFGDWLGIESIH